MPFEGETLPLSLQLHDGDAGKFVRAILVDQDGAFLPASPVTLTHLTSGKYSDDSVVMPATVTYIEVTYETFDDAGFTTLSPDHTSATDVFALEVPDTVLLDKLNEILAKLDGVSLGRGIKGKIAAAQIKGIIADVQTVKGLVVSGKLKGELVDGKLKGKVVQEKILKGKLEC